MKNGMLVLNIILAVAVGYLLYAQLSSKKTGSGNIISCADSSANNLPFRVAYFEMDSVEANFAMVKDIKAELSKKEDAINNEMDRLGRTLQQKYNYYQSQAQAGTMSQTQSEAAKQDLNALDENMKNRKQILDQEYNDYVVRRMKDVKASIEEFLKDYNQTKRYSYIVSYEQGLFYYKDTTYNITADVVKGLNDLYKPKKK